MNVENSPNPIDLHVGKRLKQRRSLLGISQQKLAGSLGITFQQVQKYESGANRVGASRLFQIGEVLEVPVSFFFDHYSSKADGGVIASIAEDTPKIEDDVLTKKETMDLIRAYYNLPTDGLRKKMLAMIKSLGEDE